MESWGLSLLPSVIALGAAALVAVALALRWPSSPERQRQRDAAARMLGLAVFAQSLHFAEEAFTGFHQRFPALFGLPAMPMSVFVGFNLACIGLWIAAVPGLRLASAWALGAAWFLAIAGAMNGIAHPLLAVAAGGYFPGLATSPLIGLAGLVLWRRMRAATVG